MKPALALSLFASVASADPLPDAPAFCEVTPCLPGVAHRRTLARDEVVGGVTCKHGVEVGVDDAGKLMYCTTARAQLIDGLPIAGDAYSLLFPDGHLYQTTLAKAHEFTLADKSIVKCKADLIAFAIDGSLARCTLAAVRDGARAGTAVGLFSSGKPAYITVEKAVAVGAITFRAGSTIAWDEHGVATGASFDAPIIVGKLTLESELTLYSHGELHAIRLAAAAIFRGQLYPEHAQLELRPDGSLAAARWQSAHGFMIHGEPWSDTRAETSDISGAITHTSTEHFQAKDPPSKFHR